VIEGEGDEITERVWDGKRLQDLAENLVQKKILDAHKALERGEKAEEVEISSLIGYQNKLKQIFPIKGVKSHRDLSFGAPLKEKIRVFVTLRLGEKEETIYRFRIAIKGKKDEITERVWDGKGLRDPTEKKMLDAHKALERGEKAEEVEVSPLVGVGNMLKAIFPIKGVKHHDKLVFGAPREGKIRVFVTLRLDEKKETIYRFRIVIEGEEDEITERMWDGKVLKDVIEKKMLNAHKALERGEKPKEVEISLLVGAGNKLKRIFPIKGVKSHQQLSFGAPT